MTLSQMIRKSTLLMTCVLASFNTAADTLLDHPGLQDLFTQRWYDVEVIVFERLDVLEFNTPEQLVQTTPRQWPGSLTWLESNPNQWDTPTLQVNGLPPQQRLDADTLLWTSRSTVDNESAQEQLINPYPQVCLGYPLMEADAVHPALLPPSPFGATSRPQRPERDEPADIDDQTEEEVAPEAEMLSEVTTPPDAIEVARTELEAAVEAFEARLYAQHQQRLPDLEMETQRKLLNRRSNLRPLLHHRWRQAVPARNAAQPLILASPADPAHGMTADGLPKLLGHMAVSAGRYLHVSTELWYHADTLGLAPLALTETDAETPYERQGIEGSTQLPARPAVPVRTVVPPGAPGTPANEANNLTDDAVASEAQQQTAEVEALLAQQRYMVLKANRRMRSGELHYLDHPKLGVIVKALPVELPTRLVDQYLAYKDLAEE